MFGLFKKKTKLTTEIITNDFGKEERELLKESTAAFKAGDTEKAIALIDQVIESYKKNVGSVSFSVYKKKANYLYKSGKSDESWRLYNELITTFAEDYITLPQIYDEMRKQLEYEKRYKDALDKGILARLLSDRSRLVQNHKYQDNTFDVDMTWEDETKLEKLAAKAEVDWTLIQKALVEEYKTIDHNSDFMGIYLKIRELI